MAMVDFGDDDDEVFDDEANDERLARFSGSTVDVSTGEKVACQLEKHVSTGKLPLSPSFTGICILMNS